MKFIIYMCVYVVLDAGHVMITADSISNRDWFPKTFLKVLNTGNCM